MSRISSKSDSVGRVTFVNVSYEYHYRSRNFIFLHVQARNHKPHVSSAVAGKPVGEISTTLPCFTSALTHNRSTISGATNYTQMDSTNAANESQLHEASMDLDN